MLEARLSRGAAEGALPQLGLLEVLRGRHVVTLGGGLGPLVGAWALWFSRVALWLWRKIQPPI